MQSSAERLLYTYLGRRTAEQVLSGRIKRGHGQKIHAVIMFCDLRDSTCLAETMAVEDFLSLLNEFFDCTGGAVLANGGEILSYVGDSVVAIFPIAGTSRPLHEACVPEEGACAAALAAARDARGCMQALNEKREQNAQAPLGFGLTLHVGDVMYGNIGVPQRLEFTVIGAAVNEAARLQDLCKALGRSVVISSAFPRCFPGQMVSLGYHSLRGVETPQEVFTLADKRPSP